MNAAINFAGVVAIAILLACVGPQLEEAAADQQAAQEAARQSQVRARFEAAAQAMCGENAGWRELTDGAVQCFTHRGHPTRKVTL